MKKTILLSLLFVFCATVYAETAYIYKPTQEIGIWDYRGEADESWGILQKFDASRLPKNITITSAYLFNYIDSANVDGLSKSARVRTTFAQDWKKEWSIEKMDSFFYGYSSYKSFSSLQVKTWSKIEVTNQVKENLRRKNKFITIRLEDSTDQLNAINQPYDTNFEHCSYDLTYGHPSNWVVFKQGKGYLKINYVRN